MVIYAQVNDTVDAICWRYYSKTAGIVEKVYEMNPHLSKQGTFLKEGTAVELPILSSEPKVSAGVKLW